MVVKWREFEARFPIASLIVSTAGAGLLASLALGALGLAVWVALSALSSL